MTDSIKRLTMAISEEVHTLLKERARALGINQDAYAQLAIRNYTPGDDDPEVEAFRKEREEAKRARQRQRSQTAFLARELERMSPAEREALLHKLRGSE